MTDRQKGKRSLTPFLLLLLGLPLLMVVSCTTYLFTYGAVTGSATLPNGATLAVRTALGHGASETATSTRVTVGADDYEFTQGGEGKLVISVNGKKATEIDADATELELRVLHGEAEIIAGDEVIPLSR